MEYRQTLTRKLRNPEVVLNLWAYADAAGYILRLAGKAYIMDGNDDDKFNLLRQLSGTDFLSATWAKVPQRFSVVSQNGETMQGATHVSLVSNPEYQRALFEPIMDSLEKELPKQLRSINGSYEAFRFKIPQAALTVTTMVVEHEDGRLEAMVS